MHALESLFLAVIASGITKKQSIEIIRRHEPDKKGGYSGRLMFIDREQELQPGDEESCDPESLKREQHIDLKY